jgi:phage shock protein A
MGIFTRARDIVNSNINAALDKAENPEKLLRHMVREMEDTLVEIKAACAGAMAGRKKAERDADEANSLAKHWTERAEMALERGRENMAREALHAKQRYVGDAESTQNVIDQLNGLVDQYKSDILQIENKLQGAREKQRVLVQRHKHSVQRKRAQLEIRKLDTSNAMNRFEEFESRLDRAEAEGELVNFGRPKPHSLEQEFVKLERDESIESELEALKQKVSGSQKSISDNKEIAIA